MDISSIDVGSAGTGVALSSIVYAVGTGVARWIRGRGVAEESEGRAQEEQAKAEVIDAQREHTAVHMLEAAQSDMRERMKRSETRTDMLEGALGQARSEITRLAQELITSTRELSAARERIAELSRENQGQAGELESLRVRAADLEAQNREQATEIDRLMTEVDGHRKRAYIAAEERARLDHDLRSGHTTAGPLSPLPKPPPGLMASPRLPMAPRVPTALLPEDPTPARGIRRPPRPAKPPMAP